MAEGARQNAPSTGEWRAIQGYEPQYALAAELALEVAAAGRLKSVRLTDPNAHIADDFQIVTDERVDAYQVKWSGKPSALTFRQFEDLFADLAQSLRQLREVHATAEVIIHLATNGLLSANDSVTNDSGTSIGPFHDFHREVILTTADHNGVETTDLSKWSAPLQELAERAGLGEADTLDVLAHLRVDIGLKLAGEGNDSVGHSPSPQELSDIQTVKAYLLRRVRMSSGKGVVEIPAGELLSESGLGNRLELRNTHQFPSPDIEYRPLAAARDQLAEFLKSDENGYVALVGPPGSGKSTLISEEFADPELRILRYYAFLPGTGLGQGERGEAEHFFYDMNLSFRLAGSTSGSGFPRSLSELRAEFLRHLADASTGFQRNGRRTVLFIDGLDHVPREQNPGRSFLNVLPLPAEIPSGVIIALGTQTTNLSDLPRQVRYELEAPARRIDISPLSEQQVREIASAEFPEEADSPWALSSRLFELSEGHPLSLAILIRRAKSSSDTPLAALGDLSAFRADIDEYYRSIWDAAEPDDELFDFIGMACRDRRPIDVRAAEKQHRRETLLRFRQHFGHVWQLDASGHLHVFHNSFRLFLLDRTACDAFGRYDESRHIELHRKLAVRYRNDQDPIRQWEAIYHFHKAGQREDALQLVTPVAVRRQLECFRQPSLLGADLRVALQLAFELQDLSKAAEIVLAWNELNLNDYAIGDQSDRFAQQLLNAGLHDQAISLMTDGRFITLTPAVCMEAAVELARAGRDSSARELFLAAEPLAALHSLDNSGRQKQTKDLETWANLAVKFRRPEQVLHLIQSAQLQELHHPYDNGGPEVLRNRLLIELAVGLQESTTGASVVNEIDEQLLQSGRAIWLELQRRRIRALDHQDERRERLAQQVVDEFRESEAKSLTVWDRLSVSEIALLDADQPTIARRMTEGLSPPQAGGHVSYEELSATHWYWFRLARVGALLGEPVDLDQVLPLHDVADRSLVKRLTTRHIAKLGHLAGQLRRNVASVPETLRDIRLIFRFLSQRDGTNFSDDSYRDVRSLRPAIIDLVLNRVANAETFDAIVDLIVEFLSDDSDSQNWVIHERVAGLEHLIEAIGPSDACRSILQRIESAWADDDSDASSRIDRSLTLASLWNQLGDHDAAISHLTSVVPQAGAVNHHDDDQINVWCGILSDANRLDSDEPAKRRRLETMVHTVLAASEMRARSYRAAEIALRDVTQSNAAEGLQLVSLFSDTGVLSFADAVGAFLVGVLRSSPDCGPLVAAVASEILLPLGEPETDLIDALATASGGARELLRLAGNVDVLSLEENRWDWHRKIVDAASKHEFAIPSPSQAAADEHKQVRSETNPVVEVGIDEKVPVDELCQQIQTPEDFRQFRATARDRSWIDTKPLTRELCRRWDAHAVAKLATIIQQHDRTGHEILVCAEQLETLGETDEALPFARHVLENCGYGYGEDWHSHGALLRAARLIERHSTKESFRDEILTALAGNLISERGGFSRNGAELFQEVFPRICTDDELLTIAGHVEDFLGHISQRTPPDKSWHCQAMPPRDAVLTLLLRCLGHPVNAISFGAQRGILTLLRSTQLASPDVESLCRSVADHPGRLMGLLAAFRAAAAGMPESVRLALPWLRETANARHFGVRNECRLIVSELGETLETRSDRHPELMRNFANRPIQAEAAVFGDEATATSSLPAAHDAQSFAFLHSFEINCLARAAGIDAEFVLRRVYEICLSQYPDSSTKTAEDALRFRLENAGLRINYQRPRAFTLEYAIHQAAAELVDAGRINKEWSNCLVPVVRISDPLLLSLEPDAMPAGIPAFHPPDPLGGEKEKWILECDAGQAAVDQLICREIENCIVLAESTCFQTGRSGLIERRMSNLWLTHTDALSDEPLLPSSTRTYATQYETAMSNEPAFAVQHPFTLSSRSPHHEWIALNANCAIAAGFNVEPSRLLGWTDGVDHVWVIRWMSGSPLVTPRENVRADGWLLVGTPGTIEKLCPESESLVRRCSVIREGEGDSECHWAEAVDIPNRRQS